MRIPANTPVAAPPPGKRIGVVIISDPQDNNVPQKAIVGDILRVELLARRDQGLWQVISTTGPTGTFKDLGFEGEHQVMQWDTAGVKPGRFIAQLQRPSRPRQPPRIFTVIVDIAAPKQPTATTTTPRR